MADKRIAPGAPGMTPKWTSSAKSGVGTALSDRSRVWFSISHGILNEVYYPRVDQACTRDFGLIVTDGQSFFSEEKRDTRSVIHPVEDGVPAFSITSDCVQGRYRIKKLVLTDPHRDVLLQHITFTALTGELRDYRLYALLAPHLVNRGSANTAWIAEYKGVPMLFAQGDGNAMALACSTPFIARSAGYVGASDGWQQLSKDFQLRDCYDEAANGNVALTGEIDLAASGGDVILALGFGHGPEEAALKVRGSLSQSLDISLKAYVAGWKAWQGELHDLDPIVRREGRNTYRTSTAVLRTHEESSFPGGYIASLSIPWGFSKGDDDLGGYHLVWPRDLVETAGGLLACGAKKEARQVIDYLRSIQELDGHWPQNCWLDGSAYWNGVQMDETALPVLLVDLAHRHGAVNAEDYRGLWPMVRDAAGYILRNGPVTGQDRWEEDGGFSPFTLATEITALLAAADLADAVQDTAMAAFLRDTADIWNSLIERWIYAENTALAQKVGVPGYYVRVSEPAATEGRSPLEGLVPIKNRAPGEDSLPATDMISPDALALVRFGLRAPDDPRILNTVKVIDAQLKVDLPTGASWHRYTGDGYGEHADGQPFDGIGIGRVWPLLTAERAHYELARGDAAKAKELLHAIINFASDGHLIPEQVWDGPDIPERELFRGRPAGSAMPLVWAHGEHIKLLRSLADGAVFDMPPQAKARYQGAGHAPRCHIWRFNHKCRVIRAGRSLRVETLAPATIIWGIDSDPATAQVQTRDSGLGLFYGDLDTRALKPGSVIVFTFTWTADNKPEGEHYRVKVEA